MGSSTTEKPSLDPQWQLDFGLRGGCVGCEGSESWPGRNPNAPWSARAQVAYRSDNTQFAFGVIGTRNYQAPLYLFEPLGVTPSAGGAAAGPLAGAAFADLSQVRTSWLLSLRLEKTLKRLQGGQTISGVGDVLVSVGGNRKSPQAPDRVLQPSSVVRGGLAFGF